MGQYLYYLPLLFEEFSFRKKTGNSWKRRTRYHHFSLYGAQFNLTCRATHCLHSGHLVLQSEWSLHCCLIEALIPKYLKGALGLGTPLFSPRRSRCFILTGWAEEYQHRIHQVLNYWIISMWYHYHRTFPPIIDCIFQFISRLMQVAWLNNCLMSFGTPSIYSPGPHEQSVCFIARPEHFSSLLPRVSQLFSSTTNLI